MKRIFSLLLCLGSYLIGQETSLLSAKSIWVVDQVNQREFMSAKVKFDYSFASFRFNNNLFINNELFFRLSNPFFEIPDSLKTLLNTIKIKENEYWFQAIFAGEFSYHYENITGYLNLHWYREIFREQKAVIENLNNSKVLRLLQSEKFLHSLIFDLKIDYQFSDFLLGISWNQISALKIGEEALVYSYDFPNFLELNIKTNQLSFKAANELVSLSLQSISLKQNLQLNTGISYYFKRFESWRWHSQLDYRLNRNSDLFVSANFQIKGHEFMDNLSIIALLKRPYIESHSPQQTIGIGLNYRIDDRPVLLPELHGIQLNSREIFSYKSDDYLSSDFATLNLMNPFDFDIFYQVSLQSEKNQLIYISELKKLGAGQIQKESIKAYLNFQNVSEDYSEDRVRISLKNPEDEQQIYQENVRIWNHHFWDGDVNGLYKFMKTNDDKLQKFIDSLLQVQADNSYEILKKILALASKGLSYHMDPVTLTDFVRYPAETYKEKRGDCEDLVVYYSSILKACGFELEIIDILGNAKQEGHVFILVNTGISPYSNPFIELNEISSLVQNGRNSKASIWIPLETTILHDGFDLSFEKGRRLLYQQVLNADNRTFQRIPVNQ